MQNGKTIFITPFRAKARINDFFDGRAAASGSIGPSPVAH